MTDRLRQDYINSLPMPLYASIDHSKKWFWPINVIDVETGCLSFDVMGKSQPSHIQDVAIFKDGEGNEHDPETFYTDYMEQQ